MMNYPLVTRDRGRKEHMNKNKKLKIINSITPIMEEKLPTPYSSADLEFLRIKRGYPEKPNLRHSFVKDGIAIKGIMLNQPNEAIFLHAFLNSCFKTINQVEDAHFKGLGLVAAGFVRFIELGISQHTCEKKNTSSCTGKCDKSEVLELNIYFRFTTDECPAGLRMMSEVKRLLKEQIKEEERFSNKKIRVHCLHGGTPWAIDDMHDTSQRSAIQNLMSNIVNRKISEQPITFL